MNGLAAQMRRAALGCARRLRSIAGLDQPQTAGADLSEVLCHWRIRRFCLKRNLGGTTGETWLVETPTGPYVLRRSLGGRNYLDYQVMVLDHLSRSAFPYAIPELVKPDDESYYIYDGRYYWMLYRFLRGSSAKRFWRFRQAGNVGSLVGDYHRAIETFDLGDMTGWFGLRSFEIDDVSQTLLGCARWLSEHQDRSELREVFLEHIDLILTAHQAVPSAEIAQYADLHRITIYNDWRLHNILTIGGRISGLIDFDAIIEAPRIVDVQNALTYILVSKNQPDRSSISAFVKLIMRSGPCRRLSSP